MTEHKYTDGEIIRDLLRCANKDVSFCKECRHRNYSDGCCIQLMKDALDLINRQKAEIERIHRHTEMYHEVRAEAIKEFAENFKQDIKNHRLEMNMNGLKGTHRTDEMTYETIIEHIDNIVKEMTEGKE